MTLEQLIGYIIQTIIILLIILIIKIAIWIIKAIYNIIYSIFTGTRNILWQGKRAGLVKRNKKNDIDRMILYIKMHITIRTQYGKQLNMQYYDNFCRNPYNVDNIKNAAYHILETIKYTGPMPTVQYNIIGNQVSKHIANQCRTYIVLNSEPQRRPEELYALLIHECMHLYLFDKKIELPGINQEHFADVLAVYLGFYDYLIIGQQYYTNRQDLNYIRKQFH